MPTCRRKKVLLTETPSHLVDLQKKNPTHPVYFLEKTGEIFETYEAYAARMSFYLLKQFQCEVTGKSGLDYFQAVESERQEALTLHSRFSEPLKPAVLRSVQWQVMGRLDHLVEAVYDRFKDRYFKGERIIVDLSGSKYSARVDRVWPPKYSFDQNMRDAHKEEDMEKWSTVDEEAVHSVGGNLSLTLEQAAQKDNAGQYYYWVHVLEPERERNEKKSKAAAMEDAQVIGSLMEVQCTMMSRDRLTFSKSILRRFIRDCVDRDPAVASPWVVKSAIAKRFGVTSDMPEETRKGVETIKKGEIDKRKKVWEDKTDGPPSKRQKKLAAQEEKLLKKERENQDKAEKAKQAKEEADRLAAEKKKKKPVRYPTEDLDVRISDKDKKAGMKVQRPLPNRAVLPFSDSPETFEAFLMSWNFLVVYGTPLHLSMFTLDEFEHAVAHHSRDQPCSLLAEIHSTLIYNLRQVPFQRHSALLSFIREKESREGVGLEDQVVLGVSTDELTGAMADVGNNWERVPLRLAEGRDGWEDALVGCLKDHANVQKFPRIREVLTRLLFAPEDETMSSSTPSSSRATTPTQGLSDTLSVISTPAERYHALSPRDRIDILYFMCNLANSSKVIHTHMEWCEEQLTALRKEKIDINRQKKQFAEELNTLAGESKEDTPATPAPEEDVQMADLSDVDDEGGKKSTARQKDLRQKAQVQQAHAKEREAARAKVAQAKQTLAEQRRLEEEVAKLDRRLEAIERDFRRLLGGVRVKPIGKDRFYNRVWWFDGLGSSALQASGGATQYCAGRIFVQGPSEFDSEILKRAEEDMAVRRAEEEGEQGMLGPNEWAVYSDVEEVEEFMAWLNVKGHREVALKNTFTKWLPHITAGLKKRGTDMTTGASAQDTRRSTRTKTHGSSVDVSREPYMLWTNKRAATGNGN